MKKVNLILLLLLLITGGIYLFGTKYGLQVGEVSVPWESDKAMLRKQTQHFLEDIAFKDFKKAATYHHPSEQAQADIAKLIEDKFHIKPEQMHITDYKVTHIEITQDGQRGRVKTYANVKLLNTDEIRDVEAVYFWQKGNDGQWYMQLRSSL